MSKYNERNIIENILANGDYPASGYLHHSGEFCVAMYGAFDGATAAIVLFTEKSDNTLAELPVLADMTFTAIPEPARYTIPRDMPFKIRVSGAGALTDISVNLHQITGNRNN